MYTQRQFDKVKQDKQDARDNFFEGSWSKATAEEKEFTQRVVFNLGEASDSDLSKALSFAKGRIGKKWADAIMSEQGERLLRNI